ncbi:Phosphoenolpyruvate/pyruvate domain-containing protein [Xylariaceae sp. FL1651]|nr:Phosphoenolpyruvate/pyruvate domain-containing protein [Xylariaceae sp. FL1651]
MATPLPPTTSATHFASLHVPGNPLVIPNIWDLSSLNSVLSLNSSAAATEPPNSSPNTGSPVKAVATASYAIAATLGLADEDLSLGANLIRIRRLAPHVRAAGLPLTVDIQDGYGERLDEVVRAVVEAGAVGANVEDLRSEVDERGSRLWALEEQVTRLRRVVQIARESGCAEFVLNARCDVFNPASRSSYMAHGERGEEKGDDEKLLDEAVRRGRAYLEAGATTVFVWGGPSRGLRDHEIRALVREFEGRLAVKLGTSENSLSVKDLADMGVARITVGPSLYLAATRTIREGAERIVDGGKL